MAKEAEKKQHLIGEDIVEIDFAREFQEAVVSSKVLSFKDESLKNKILNADGNQLIVVTSNINSPKLIKGVDYYDKSFLLAAL